MLNSYVPFCFLLCVVMVVALRIYVPWWMWIVAVICDSYTIKETREWRRERRRNRDMREEVDRQQSEGR